MQYCSGSKFCVFSANFQKTLQTMFQRLSDNGKNKTRKNQKENNLWLKLQMK